MRIYTWEKCEWIWILSYYSFIFLDLVKRNGGEVKIRDYHSKRNLILWPFGLILKWRFSPLTLIYTFCKEKFIIIPMHMPIFIFFFCFFFSSSSSFVESGWLYCTTSVWTTPNLSLEYEWNHNLRWRSPFYIFSTLRSKRSMSCEFITQYPTCQKLSTFSKSVPLLLLL